MTTGEVSDYKHFCFCILFNFFLSHLFYDVTAEPVYARLPLLSVTLLDSYGSVVTTLLEKLLEKPFCPHDVNMSYETVTTFYLYLLDSAPSFCVWYYLKQVFQSRELMFPICTCDPGLNDGDSCASCPRTGLHSGSNWTGLHIWRAQWNSGHCFGFAFSCHAHLHPIRRPTCLTPWTWIDFFHASI